MTNSHDLASSIGDMLSLAVGGAHHVAALPPEAQAAGMVAAVVPVSLGMSSLLRQRRFQMTQSH